MITHAEAMDEGGPLRPLHEMKAEEEHRLLARLQAIDEEFARAFGPTRPVTEPASAIVPGPEPWAGFLDLSCL